MVLPPDLGNLLLRLVLEQVDLHPVVELLLLGHGHRAAADVALGLGGEGEVLALLLGRLGLLLLRCGVQPLQKLLGRSPEK